MARGWESKSVEDQIADARAEKRVPAPEQPPEERARDVKRTSLKLARAKTLQDLQQACDRRHRAVLEHTLEHLDAEIRKIES
ncbi:MAG: hypothetical protein ABI634_11670 [Acidobacteriota bacterium]